MLESNVSYVYSHKYTNIKINSDNNCFLEKTLHMQNVVILVDFFNKNQYHYYYQSFLGKCSYKYYKITIL